MRCSLNYTGTRNCPLKIEISQLPNGLCLNCLVGDWVLKVANIKDKSNSAGVLPFMGYIGMCRCEGYGFQAVYSRIGYTNQLDLE